MSIKSKKFKLSFIPYYFKQLVEFGREHRYQSRCGSLHPGAISRKIIEFVLDTRSREDVVAYLKKHGGTYLDLVSRALTDYIKKHI